MEKISWIRKLIIKHTGKVDGKRGLPREAGPGGPHTSPFIQGQIIASAQLDEKIDFDNAGFFGEAQETIDRCNARKAMLLEEARVLEARLQNPGQGDDTELFKLELFNVKSELAALDDTLTQEANRKSERGRVVEQMKRDNHTARDQRLSVYWDGALFTNTSIPPMPDIPGLVRLYSLIGTQAP